MAERELLVSHSIGANGRFRLVTSSGSLRIDGIDGDTVEVRARYRAPAGVALGDDPEIDGVVRVDREPGALTLQVSDPGGSGFLAGFTRKVSSYRPDVDFEVRVPRSAAVWLQTTSADGELHGLRGDQELRTISGDLELDGAGGRLKVITVSGDVSVTGDVLSLSANTTSGDIAVDAELVEQLAARAVSGDISIRAALGRDGVHSFDAVSGDLQLATASGVTVEMSGLSGSVRSDQPSRREVRDGRKVIVVGDGAVTLRARTVSGDVVLTGPRGGSGRTQPSEPFGFAADMAQFGREMAAFGAGLARDVTAATASGAGGWPTMPTPPTPPTPPSPPSWPSPPSPPTPPTPPSAPVAPTPPTPDATAQLAILRKLEAGEIGVDEAARRLEALA